jgi:uncharacterized protein
LVLRADVFRPIKEGRYPVLLSHGPYAKGLAFQDGYPSAWQRMAEQHPDVTGSSNKYQNWEVADPEKWVPHDYVCVRVDSRGRGCSPGYIDHFSPRETKEFYNCIEWPARRHGRRERVEVPVLHFWGPHSRRERHRVGARHDMKVGKGEQHIMQSRSIRRSG